MAGAPIAESNQTPRRRAASTSGRMRPSSSTMLFGGGANMWVTMSPGLSRSKSLGSGETRLPHVDHHRQIEGGGHLLRAPQHLVVVGAGDIPREPRLDADDEVAVLRDGVARRTDIGAADVHGVAVGQDAGAPDVDQHAAGLRRRPGDGNRVGDAIRSLRSGIDQPGDAVREAERGTVLVAGGVGMDVEQARDDDLAARIDRVARASAAMLASTAAMRPPAIATSRIASSLSEGSMTRPP